METVTVVLNVREDQVEAFERGFREHELPVWHDLKQRGLLIAATLNRLDISSRPVKGAVQYLVAVIFASGEGHHVHDSHPGFAAWNEIADTYQTGEPMAFAGHHPSCFENLAGGQGNDRLTGGGVRGAVCSDRQGTGDRDVPDGRGIRPAEPLSLEGAQDGFDARAGVGGDRGVPPPLRVEPAGAVDRGQSQLAGAGVREPVCLAGRADDDMPALDHDRLMPDAERRLTRLDDEHLAVRVTVQLRPDTRLRVDEDHAERDVAMLRTHEFVRMVAVVELIERHDIAHWQRWYPCDGPQRRGGVSP